MSEAKPMLRRTPLKSKKGIERARARLRRSLLRRAGKKGKRWTKVRAELKREFLAMGVTACEGRWEGCMGDDGLTFAHSLKRRHITTDAQMREVVCLCVICHDRIEVMGEERMSGIVRGIIAARP